MLLWQQNDISNLSLPGMIMKLSLKSICQSVSCFDYCQGSSLQIKYNDLNNITDN